MALPLEEAQTRLGESLELLRSKVKGMESKATGMEKELHVLKAQLYGKFKNSINLERS